MDPTALRELIALESGQFDASFEYWIGASFAVVVAVHTARDSMLKFHRYTLCTVYILFCFVTTAKAAADLAEIAHINELLSGTALDVNTLPNRIAAFSRLVLYVVFSVVVVAFILMSGYSTSDSNDG